MSIDQLEYSEFKGIKGEQALWRAVIVQALMDAGSNSQKMEAKYEKSQAECWLTGYGEDFKVVCDFAGFNADYVRTKSKQALARGCKWRSESPSSSQRKISHPNKCEAALAVGFGAVAPTKKGNS